jgi:hypothetical protein
MIDIWRPFRKLSYPDAEFPMLVFYGLSSQRFDKRVLV